MNGVGFGGLLELAVALASGFMLCRIEPIRIHLRRQLPPVPYFTFLACGVAWWMIAPALITVLTSVCQWLDSVSLSWVCMPTASQLLDNFTNKGGRDVLLESEWRRVLRTVDVFFSALAFWVVFYCIFHILSIVKWTASIFPCEGGILKILKTILQIHLLIQKALRERTLFKFGLEGYEFEKMVWRAMDNKMLLMLTLSSNKVYIGHPYRVFPDDSGQDKWIGFYPRESGYRDKEKLGLILTTDYKAAFRKEGARPGATPTDMSIPLREIVSCQFFDHTLYSRFQAEELRKSAEAEGKPNEGGGSGKRTEGKLGPNSGEMDSPRFGENDDKREKEANKE